LSAGDALCGGGGSTSWLHGKCCYCCGAGYYCSEEEEEALVHFNNVTVFWQIYVSWASKETPSFNAVLSQYSRQAIDTDWPFI